MPLPPIGIQPGVITGKDYETLLTRCRVEKYALPAINVTSSSAANAVMAAAAKNQSDVIIQISAGGARFYAGNNLENIQTAQTLGAVAMAQHIHLLAQHYKIGVVLHTDHANRPLIPWLESLIEHSTLSLKSTGRPLFSSHMLDLSNEPLEANINESRRLLKRLSPLEIGLEIELGITGGEEDGVGTAWSRDLIRNPMLYTQASDVLHAWESLSSLGMLSIAASFGNVHGVYQPGNIHLRPEILKECQELVRNTHHLPPNPLPLVFHGGSGSDVTDIQKAVSYGVFKMNIDTDTQFAFSKGVANYISNHVEAFQNQICPQTGHPFKRTYDVRQWLHAGEQACISRLSEAFKILGSRGRTLTQRI